jgi:ribosome-associated protein
MDDSVIVTPGGIRIDPAALTWRLSRAAGPGGQHVNKTESRVELLCDLTLAGLSPTTFGRITERLGGTEVRITASEHRSQLRNRMTAIEKLGEQLDLAARPVRKRRATRPSKGSVERRLDAKRRDATRKGARRWKPDD